MKDDILYPECREMRHAWKPYTARKVIGGFTRVLLCERCEAFKTQDLDSRGMVLSTRMQYPERYLRKGKGRLSAVDLGKLRLGNVLSMSPAHVSEES